MATKHGYRIFSVDIHKGFTRALHAFPDLHLGEKATAEPFADTIRAVCVENKGKTHTEVLRYREPRPATGNGDVEDTTPFVRLLKYDLTPGTRFDFEYKFGRRGSHDLAMAEDEANDASLANLAPSNSFRAFLYLPKAGTKAILVAEARNRLCPALDLLKLLGVGSKTIDERRAEDARIGWWRPIGSRVTDDVQMKKFIQQGHANYIELRKTLTSGSAKTKTEIVKVRQDGLPIPKKGEQAKALVGSWLGLNSSDMGTSQPVPQGNTLVKQLASLIEVKVDPTQFDDGGVGWEGPDGSTIFVKPDDLEDAFTYRVGRAGYRPTDDALRLAAEETLRGLQTKLKLDLDI